jgi:F0F1-type ATP synthase membrane subunit b/b'
LVVALAGPELAPILKEEFVRFLGSERSRDAVKSQFISFLHSDEGKRLLVELLKEALAGRELAPILKGAEKSLKNLAAEQVVSFRTDAEMELKESAASHTVELERKARKAAQDIAGQANRVYQDLRDHVSLHQAEMERKARKAAQDIAEVYQDFLDHLGSYRAEIVEAIKEQLSILIRKEIERHESIPDFSWYPPAFFKKVDSLELSAHTASSLKNSNIVYIGDLVQKTKNEMLHIPNFGPRSLNEIKEVLAQMGLHLGMELPGWPPDNIDELAKRFEEDNY